MSIREALNNNRRVTTGIVGAVTVLAIGLVVWQATGGDGAPPMPTRAFYTTDEGKTWFVEDAFKPAPFDRGGKPAYGAVVLRCGSGEPRVGYLTRLAGGFHKEAGALKPSDPDFQLRFLALQQQGLEVRKPAETAWHRVDNPGGQQIVEEAQRCADGRTAQPVMP